MYTNPDSKAREELWAELIDIDENIRNP